MNIDFVLIASGSLNVARVNHALFVDSIEKAKREASDVVSTLSKAGYYTFDLFDVRAATHVNVATFRADIPEPVVTITKSKS